MSKENILRRLAALRGKFAEGSGCTVEEAETAMAMYLQLKQKYDISDDEVSVKAEGISCATSDQFNGTNIHPIVLIVPKISRLTGARGFRTDGTNVISWIGTRADIEHAQFIYTVVTNALAGSWKAYRYSFAYTKAKQEGIHGRQIRSNFEKGFVVRICMKLDEMIAAMEANRGPGTALVVCKQALIKAFIDSTGAKTHQKNQRIALRNPHEALVLGYNEGDKVKLRQEFRNDTQLLEHQEGGE